MSEKICTKCLASKYIETDFSRQRSVSKYTHKVRYYTSAVCKVCTRKRVKAWTFRNAARRNEYEKLRSTFKNRRTILCAYCRSDKGEMRSKHTIAGHTAYYHPNCLEWAYNQKGLVSPKRKQELEALMEIEPVSYKRPKRVYVRRVVV